MLFELGRIVATPGALQALEAAGQQPAEFLDRHASGDCGDIDQRDRIENWSVLVERYRFISVYHTSTGSEIWVITERDRGVTTVLLPEECQAGGLNFGGLA